MRMTWMFAFVLAAGCSNKLSGTLEIDGHAVEISSCRNGMVYGFRGVELTAATGERLRVALAPTGEAVVILMAKGASTGAELGKCGSLEVSDQNSEINDVKNVEGKMELDCAADGSAIKGSVKFGNCH